MQTNPTGMCGKCSQCLGHTGFAPTHGVCTFTDTAQAPGCSPGELSKVSPGLSALPRSKLLRFRFSSTPPRQTWLGLCFVSFPGLSSSGNQVLGKHTLPRWTVHLITSPVSVARFLGAQQEHRLGCAVCLLWGDDLWLRPSWWMSTIQDPKKTCLATGSLLTVW